MIRGKYKLAQPLPKSQWMSVGTVRQEVNQLLKQFATVIPVLIHDSIFDIGIKPADDGVTSGMVYKGVIRLFRDGMADRDAVEHTVWHEFLHFGLRRFMT